MSVVHPQNLSYEPLDPFILDTLTEFSDQECSQLDLRAWHRQTKGDATANMYKGYNFRDALYRLETKGLVERYFDETEQTIYWRVPRH